MSDQININVNGSEIRTDSDQLIIEACEDSGIHIPRFCWHKRMDPVGMCRMCLVEIETPRGKALVPSCTTKVSEDLVVDTESEVVKKAQEGVLEFLLINFTLHQVFGFNNKLSFFLKDNSFWYLPFLFSYLTITLPKIGTKN